MWCKNCYRETENDVCELCGEPTSVDIPTEIYWCNHCKTPIIVSANSQNKTTCTLCLSETKYMCSDMRPVFPEERLLIEVIEGKPFAYINNSVWASATRYYIDGKAKTISNNKYMNQNPKEIIDMLNIHKSKNDYSNFNEAIDRFIKANSIRLNEIVNEATSFIRETANKYPIENIIISFSGGKDSTVTADLAVRALSEPSLVHIFGDTTLEFPLTYEYVDRFRKNNPLTILKTAKNKEQNFYEVCDDIGPPARMLRWCCSMFKTGPITRVINNMYRNSDILTFYGIRKGESVSRSKYNRVEDSADAVKIHRQKVASPIFYWNNADIWLYILSEQVDFNDAYRLGYDRVGCWCCPNNSIRAQFLSSIYMPEQTEKWRDFLISFAKRIGKEDADVYVDTGKWKARQGGNGVKSSEDVKLRFTNCTNEENAKIYSLTRPIDDCFIELFIPFGKISKTLGRKLLNETIIVDLKTNVPIISIQPFGQEEYEFSVKVKTMNVADHDDLHRMISYQIRKHNACRKCLKCESLCKHGAITIYGNEYHINEKKCTRCKMCVTAKYLAGGCLMDKYLRTKE